MMTPIAFTKPISTGMVAAGRRRTTRYALPARRT
jgi:hypothetical protein